MCARTHIPALANLVCAHTRGAVRALSAGTQRHLRTWTHRRAVRDAARRNHGMRQRRRVVASACPPLACGGADMWCAQTPPPKPCPPPAHPRCVRRVCLAAGLTPTGRPHTKHCSIATGRVIVNASGSRICADEQASANPVGTERGGSSEVHFLDQIISKRHVVGWLL